MPQTVVDKVVIVTGASSGIGAATAREFARQGARVVLIARHADKLIEQVAQIMDAGGRALAVPADVTSTEQVQQLVEQARTTFGPIDILVNNAGANWGKPLSETTTDEIVRLLHVNLLGTMLLTHAVLPDMQRRHQGAIISVGSVASHVAIEPLYSAAKFGVRGFSLALRRQLTGSGITISLVSPGNIRTQMTRAIQEPMPEPEVVASVIARLAVTPRREVILPLKYHGVVWLDRLFPGVADFAFYWRHRQDRKQGNYSNLPAYARAPEQNITE
jgi:NAD(P)-dependent dehydrogenase (short-subunit alcohol dehydrogenase family)